MFSTTFFIRGETKGQISYTKEVQVNVCGIPKQNSSVNATYDMLDYNSTTLSFESANLTALFEQHSQCSLTISNVYLPDLTSNLSTKQIATLINYKSKKMTLVVDSIDLEAKYQNLGALYPTKLEFVVEGQLDADVA